MRDEEAGPGITFATWFRSTRIASGMTQEQLIEATNFEVSKPTLNRWENGKAIGDPGKVRVAVLAMGADPREAAVHLGLVTREEWDLPPAPTAVDMALVEPARVLADEKISVAARDFLRALVGDAMKYWRSQTRTRRAPTEPSADERSKGKPVKRD